MLSLKLMAASDRLSHRFLSLLAVPALVVVMASCGTDDGLGKRYPVSGTVNYNGKPLEKGVISFVSDDLSKNVGATGSITNGSYTLSTGGDNDGAQAGKYKVTVTSKDDSSAQAEAAFQKETGKDNKKLPPQFIAKAAAAIKSNIPAGYGDPRTTTLTAEVEAKSNTFNFELSDTAAPPEPAAGASSKVGRGRH